MFPFNYTLVKLPQNLNYVSPKLIFISFNSKLFRGALYGIHPFVKFSKCSYLNKQLCRLEYIACLFCTLPYIKPDE